MKSRVLKPILVFDLDGTLAETAGDLVAALNAVVAPEGLRPTSFAEARHMVGAGAKAMIQRAYAAQDRALDPDTLERLFRHFLDHYEAHICDESQLFPGVAAALDRLSANGFDLRCLHQQVRASVAEAPRGARDRGAHSRRSAGRTRSRSPSPIRES